MRYRNIKELRTEGTSWWTQFPPISNCPEQKPIASNCWSLSYPHRRMVSNGCLFHDESMHWPLSLRPKRSVTSHPIFLILPLLMHVLQNYIWPLAMNAFLLKHYLQKYLLRILPQGINPQILAKAPPLPRVLLFSLG